MGWQERDWAKWTDEERARFLGARRVDARSWEPGQPSPRSGVGIRSLVWGAVAIAVAVVAAGAFVGRGTLAPGDAPLVPVAVYGDLVSADSAALGGRGICTREVAGATGWVCTEYSLLAPSQTPAQARPYVGQCVERKADQQTAQWVCVRGPAGLAPTG